MTDEPTWKETARQYAVNADYWEARCEKAEARVLALEKERDDAKEANLDD